jgi:hypothetical protein
VFRGELALDWKSLGAAITSYTAKLGFIGVKEKIAYVSYSEEL